VVAAVPLPGIGPIGALWKWRDTYLSTHIRDSADTGGLLEIRERADGSGGVAPAA
jgi:hypothetical protein